MMNAPVEVTIRETSEEDLPNLLALWNNGEVMKFVGYPDGLGVSLSDMHKWLPRAIQKPLRCHYSIYAAGSGYCGETFYSIDDHNSGMLDIKLLPAAQGKGIAYQALSIAIDKAFTDGGAERVYVDPRPENCKAWALYEKLGFSARPRPGHLEPAETYLEITREEWLLRSNNANPLSLD